MNEIANNSKKKTPLKSHLRLTARITGTIWVVFYLFLIVVGYIEGLQSKSNTVSKQPDILLIASVACLMIALTGLLIAWWRAGIGGLISLFGFIITGVLFIIDPKLIFSLPVFAISLLPSILYLVYWWLTEKSSAENSKS